MLLLGVVLFPAGITGVTVGVRGLWAHRAAWADIRAHPIEDDPDALEKVRQALGRVDDVVDGLPGQGGGTSVPLDAVAGMRGLGKMPEPLQVPGIALFFGAVLVVTGILFVVGYWARVAWWTASQAVSRGCRASAGGS